MKTPKLDALIEALEAGRMYVERRERVGPEREYECNGITCQWCERGFRWLKDGDRHYHKVCDEVVVRYLPEAENERLKELALAHASALDECRAENKRLRLVLAERDEQVANMNTAMQTAMSAHTIEQARKVLREGVLNA